MTDRSLSPRPADTASAIRAVQHRQAVAGSGQGQPEVFQAERRPEPGLVIPFHDFLLGSRAPPKIPGGRFDAVREMVRARRAEPLSLEDLAAEAGISKFHFARLFRQHTDTTPHAFLLEVRLDAVYRLRAETG